MIDRVRPIVHFLRCLNKYGVRVAIKLYAPSECDVLTIEIPNISSPFHLPRNRVGRRVFDGVLVQEQYRPRTAALEDVRFIVDAGAHVGLASLYFANTYPAATVLSIEPNEGNFALLRENTIQYSRIRPLRAALWYRASALEISNPAALSWAYRVEESDHGDIPAVTIPQLIAQSGHNRIDILKLDIEGAEKELFDHHASEWLPMVRCLAIELHDRFRPGDASAVFGATASSKFRHEHRKEVDFFFSPNT